MSLICDKKQLPCANTSFFSVSTICENDPSFSGSVNMVSPIEYSISIPLPVNFKFTSDGYVSRMFQIGSHVKVFDGRLCSIGLITKIKKSGKNMTVYLNHIGTLKRCLDSVTVLSNPLPVVGMSSYQCTHHEEEWLSHYSSELADFVSYEI